MGQIGQGTPVWFELGTSDIPGAGAFYHALLGWDIADSGMEGMVYHLARDGDAMAAGIMANMGPQGTPPYWMAYIEVDDIDASLRAAETAGGQVLNPVTAVPGTGRFAILADPTGAVIGLLQSDPMETPPDPDTMAWHRTKPGRANWLELMTSDPAKALGFYTTLFGWTKEDAIQMDGGPYQMFAHKGEVIGGMMGLMGAPMPYWLPYFGARGGANDTAALIRAHGGTVLAGPNEVPGPAFVVIAQDPQGAAFAMVSTAP